MKLTFLGTGTSQGIPIIANNHPVCLSDNSKDKRLRSSVLISWDEVQYVIDCGPDFRQQMLREKVAAINGVFFTHEHADHTAGFDDIRPFCTQIGAMPIYATTAVLKNLKKRFDYIFAAENRYVGAPKVTENIVENASFSLHKVLVTPIAVLHGNVPVTCYRFGDIAYLTDVKIITDSEKKKLQNLDILVVNALRITEHPTHFNLEEALAFIKEINPKKAYLTHISHRLGFHNEVEKQLPKNVFLAYDGLQVEG